MTRIFLVDDNALMRSTMRQLIEMESDLKVCGEADTVEKALKLLKQIKVDIALVDISLGGDEQGIELIRNIRADGHTFPVLTISLHEEALYAHRVQAAGAQGYLMKQDAPENIIQAIHSVLRAGKDDFFTVGSPQV